MSNILEICFLCMKNYNKGLLETKKGFKWALYFDFTYIEFTSTFHSHLNKHDKKLCKHPEKKIIPHEKRTKRP